MSDDDVLPWTPYLSDIMLEGEATHTQHEEDRLINEIATVLTYVRLEQD